RFCGDPCSAGLSVFERSLLRPTRTSWLTVGTNRLRMSPLRTERGKGLPDTAGTQIPAQCNLTSLQDSDRLSRAKQRHHRNNRPRRGTKGRACCLLLCSCAACSLSAP